MFTHPSITKKFPCLDKWVEIAIFTKNSQLKTAMTPTDTNLSLNKDTTSNQVHIALAWYHLLQILVDEVRKKLKE